MVRKISVFSDYFFFKKHKRKFIFGLIVIIPFIIFILSDLFFPLKIITGYSTIVTDSKGAILHVYLNNSDKWRMYTEIEEITPTLKKAIIFKEDKYFYIHPGINPAAVIRALYKNITTGKRTSGASTIAMQVARLLNPKKRTYLNKFAEMFRALQLEWHYSKNEILQMYLNLVPYGGNIEGVKAASMIYFNKLPDHLSIAEIAALSIIPNRPNSLKPGSNLLEKERNRWLKLYLKANLFPEQDIRDALEEPLPGTKHEIPYFAPHLCNRLYKTNKNKHTIHSTLILETQLKVESIVKEHINRWYFRNVKNAAALVIENKTGNVIAYAGSANFFNASDGGQVDGIKAIRSPGSTLKPLIYGLAFDKGLITPKMVISDVPVYYSGYEPENYDGKYHGLVNIEYALSNSLNIPAVKIMDELGTETVVHSLIGCGFKQIQKDLGNLGLSVALGGCGVTLEELTKLYLTFSNNGTYKQVNYIVADETKRKKTKKDVSTPPRNILSDNASFLITEILTKVTRPDLPLEWQNSAKLPKVAWKTGTSYGRRDAWSMGYNKNYTVGVWVGNFSGEGVPELSGSDAAAPLLFNIFNLIDYGTETNWYEAPSELYSRIICASSGKVPSDFCTDLAVDYYIPGISPMQQCTHLKKIYVSPDSSISYCMSCLPSLGYKEKLFPDYAPEVIAYYDKYLINYIKIPPHNPNCNRIFAGASPVIISPQNNADYYIDEHDTMQIALKCNAANDVEKIYWYINKKFYKMALPSEKVFFNPAEGRTEISCSDDKGRNSDVFITVKKIEF